MYTELSSGASPRVVLRAFLPKVATPEQWQAFHAYLRLRAREENPDDPIVDDEVRQRDMQTDWPLFEEHRVLALVDDEIVGSLAMWTRRPGTADYEAHARFVSADAGVRRSARRQVIGTRLLGELAALMDRRAITTATLSARVGDGTRFLAAIGAAEKHSMMENRLELARVDRAMLQAWEDGAGATAGLDWEIHRDRVPLDRYKELIPQLNVMLNSQPLGTLDTPPLRFDIDQLWTWYAEMDAHGGDHSLVLLKSGEQIVAMSEATWSPELPDRAFQNLTAIAPDWRGKGLAKAVKARLMRELVERRPSIERIITSNANVNAAMLAINTQLGFVLHKEVKTFQIDLAAIEAVLAQRLERFGG
jgi:GNAT superfamily N-acetyltransferase